MNIIEWKVKWEVVVALLVVIVIMATCMRHMEKKREPVQVESNSYK